MKWIFNDISVPNMCGDIICGITATILILATTLTLTIAMAGIESSQLKRTVA